MSDESKAPLPVEVREESAQEAYVRVDAKRIPPIGPKSPIARAFQLKNDRVMLLCEDGNRIWFTPGREDGNPELQADYAEFLKTHRLEGV